MSEWKGTHSHSVMTWTHRPPVLFLFLLLMLGLTSCKDAEVTCLFQEDCVLPCTFLRGGMVIHWYKQQIPVHSYYYQKDQLRLQNKHFSGRTHLFNAHIANGNASLMLRRVKVQDQGRYKCFTSTRKDSQETFINLRIKAVIPLVRMEMTNESVTCLSQNIYPAPEVLWSTEPPAPPGSLVNSTQKTADSRSLFTVESSVGIVGNLSDYTYFCSVISADRSQEWTASQKQQDDLFGESGRSLLIPCMAPKPLQNFTLSWTFSIGRDPRVLLTYDSRTQQTSGPWKGRAELDEEQVLLGNGSLHILNPESVENTGSYRCTFSTLQTRHLLQTWVNITDRSADKAQRVCKRSWWGTAASICVFVLTMAAGVLRCLRMGGRPAGHATGGKLVKISMSQIDVPMLDLSGTDPLRSHGSGPKNGSSLRLHATKADLHVIQAHKEHGCVDFQRHPIPECGAEEIEALGRDEPEGTLRGSDMTIPPEFGTDSPAPPVVDGDSATSGSESVVPGALESDSEIPNQPGGGDPTPQVTGSEEVTALHRTGSNVPNSAIPGHVVVIHCEPERAPKDQTHGLGTANSDSYFLKLALFPSHKDLSTSIVPNILESEESIFIVPEQFQINGFR